MGTISLGLPFHLVERPLVLAGKGCAAFLRLVLVWQDRAETRNHLAGLDERGLKDIGLTRADVDAECVKPFWRV